MSDQNQNSQNSFPGTIRTLKTDLGIDTPTNPQDRLQQAGNFVQARPTLEPTPATTKPPVNAITTPTPAPAPTPIAPGLNPISENKTVEKKDIPATEVNPKPTYSWSNMNLAQPSTPKTEFNLNVKQENLNNPIPTKSNVSDNKPGFSVLEDTIDLPLDNKVNTNLNKSNENQINTNIFNTDQKSNKTEDLNLNIPNFQDSNVKPKSKSSTKSIISIVVVVVLLLLIGGGVYAFNISKNNAPSKTTENKTDTNNTPIPNPEVVVSNPLFKGIPKIDIAFVDTQPIRQTILSQLADKKDSLIELNLTKDSNKVALTDIADALILTIPTDILSSLKDYWLYGYNQEGIYKLTAVIQLSEDKIAKESVDNWLNSIPRDLSGFSINLPSRIVNVPTIKNTTVINNSGKSFTNNYYNYTSPADSIDVSSYENYILMASSKDSMRYILNQIP